MVSIPQKRWNWQQADWPDFRYDSRLLIDSEAAFLKHAGMAVGAMTHLQASQQDDLRIELISEEAVQTSAIEGEFLNRDSVQVSLRKQFGLQADSRRVEPAESGIAVMMTDLYRGFAEALSDEAMFRWHRSLTNGRTDLQDVGAYRTHADPMVVVSGRYDKPKIHFEAPPSKTIPKEMKQFVRWFNRSAPGGAEPLSALLRAGIAHFYFVSIHPFEDGNGRIGRAIAEKSLAQNVGAPTLISLSLAIVRNRKDYYRILEASNKNNSIDPWLEWFAQIVLKGQEATQAMVKFVIEKTKLYDRLRGKLNERQEKVLERMLREGPDGFKGGMTAEKCIHITKTSRATATRDLQDLVEKGALLRHGELKLTRYFIPFVPASPTVIPRGF